MKDLRPLISDYKANVPLHMLEAKYGIPIHKIVSLLYATLMLKLKKDM